MSNAYEFIQSKDLVAAAAAATYEHQDREAEISVFQFEDGSVLIAEGAVLRRGENNALSVAECYALSEALWEDHVGPDCTTPFESLEFPDRYRLAVAVGCGYRTPPARPKPEEV